jgi:parvulin-like peptidyl-prolyl isomerase
VERALSIASALAAVALSAVMAFKSAPPIPSSAGPLSREAPVAEREDAGAAKDSGSADAGRADASEALEVPAIDLTALGAGSPRHVGFGVVLVMYDGAQGAPDKARSRAEALTLATKLADEAKSDFHAAVQHGDTGSTDDVGQVARGVLEAPSEAVLFALPVGGVSGVIDTPRGFWIVKRLE